MGAELRVDVADVGSDGCHGDDQFGGYVRRLQVGREVAQHAKLSVGEWLRERRGLGGSRESRVSGQAIKDLGDQRGVGGVQPPVPLQ